MNRRFAHRGARDRQIGIWRTIVPLAFGLLLGACYGVKEEVIAPEKATTRAGLPGRYLAIEGGTADPKEWVRIEAIPGSHDYRFQMPNGKGAPLGTLRLLSLNETIWLAQLAPEGESGAALIFLRFKGERVHVLVSDAPDDELRALAGAHGVTGQGIMGGPVARGGTLDGDPADILSLMRAVAERRVTMSADYYKKR